MLGTTIFSVWPGNKIWPIWKRFIWDDNRGDPRQAWVPWDIC